MKTQKEKYNGAYVTVQPFKRTKVVRQLEAFYMKGGKWYSIKTNKLEKK